MRIKLRQPDGTWKAWDYNERLDLQEAMTMKDKLGLTVLGFTEGLAVMDPYALAGLVWLCRFRAGERELDPRTINFQLEDLDIEVPDDPQTEGGGDPTPAPAGDPTPAGPPAASSTTPTPAQDLEDVTGAAV